MQLSHKISKSRSTSIASLSTSLSPLVSVVIPCYNQANYLGDAIESALTQSYRNVEIVVVNDGSTDDTEAVATSYPEIQYIMQQNQGLASARNTGLRYSTGDFIVFLDSDDRLLPTALECGSEFLNLHPEYAFVSGHYRLISTDGQVLPTWREMRYSKDRCFVSGPYHLIAADGTLLDTWPHHKTASDHYAVLLQRNYIVMHATVMYRRSVFDCVGGFDPFLRACEDYDIYLRIARQFPIACHNHVVAEYRKHESNMTRNSSLMLTSALQVLHSQWEFVEGDIPYEQSYKLGAKLWQEFYAIQAAKDSISLFKQLAWKKAAHSAKLPVQHGLTRAKTSALGFSKFLGAKLKKVRHRLTRIPMGRVKFGTLRRTTPKSSAASDSQKLQTVDHYYLGRFLSGNSSDIRGSILVVEDNHRRYQVAGQALYQRNLLEGNTCKQRVKILTDLAELDKQQADYFDCIIAPHVLHQIYDFKNATNQIYRLLKPEGVLLATFPGFSLNGWGDTSYWAISTQLAQKLFTEAFPTSNVTVDSYGNVLAATALLHGLPASELEAEELDDQDRHYQILVSVKVVKPSVKECQKN